MFAVVEISGKQYKVQEKDVIDVDKIEEEAGKTIKFDKVLLFSGEKGTKVGTPYLDGVSVTAKVKKHFKGDKIEVRRFKSKVRYRRKTGFRPMLTQLEILSIAQK